MAKRLKKMKVGLVLSNSPAYSETFFNSKIKGLQAQGVEVVLFTQSTNTTFNLCPVVKAPKVHANPLTQLLSMLYVYICLLPKMKTLRRYIALERQANTTWTQLLKKIYLNAHILKNKLDWLHFGFATQAIGSEHVAKAIKANMAVSFRGFDINVYPIKHPECYKTLWNNIDKVHSISKYLLQQAHSLGLNAKTPYEIITPAIADELINIPDQYKVLTQPTELLTIARLHWIKGIDVLIETANILKDKGFEFLWRIIGDGDQKNTERYQYHIYEKGLQQHIQFLGKCTHEQTLTELQRTDIYVQTSINEGFCNAVLEAQAMSKLCIATNVGGLSENIADTKTGWLTSKNDPLALSKKIIEVANLPQEVKNKVTVQAVNRVKSGFLLSQQQQKFVAFYQGNNFTNNTK